MSQHNDTKTNLAATHTLAIRSQASKRQLLANFVKFMAWVIVIGLLLSPLGGEQSVALDNLLHSKKKDKAEGAADD